MELLVLLGVLVCPFLMGGMMLWMMIRMRAPAARDREDEQQ